ncbi:MAG: FMN-binding protein [Nocardioides sp.]
MRRISLWLLSTVSAVVLLFGYHTSTIGALTTQPAVISSSVKAGSSTGTTTSGGASGSGGSGGGSDNSGSSANSGGTSTDTASPTTLTGAVAQTQWGPVQVQLAVDSGSITQVSVLQYPSGNSRDDQINSYALPILVDETVQAQSAEIDMVSGATVTSVGYLQSLQNALDQAGL